MTNDSIQPVRKTLQIPLAPGAAFDLFTMSMERWWPFETHSVFEKEKKAFRFECHKGGRLVETGPGGEDSVWGTVLAFDRPHEARFTWHPGRGAEAAQEITVTFAREGSGTLVTLIHSGWEVLGDRAAEVRANYETGWDMVFGERFGGAAGTASKP